METDLNRIAEIALGALKKEGAEKAQVDIGTREIHEVNIESGRFSLLRTTFDQGISMRAIVDQRQANMSGNQFPDGEIFALAKETMTAARASAQDPAFNISPVQSAKKFRSGPEVGDVDAMTTKADDVLVDIARRFPKIIMEQMIVKFSKRTRTLANTNGVHFETAQNEYDVTFMFTAKDGKRQSGMAYTGASFAELGAPFLSFGGIETLLRQSVELMDAKAMEGKFVGDIVVTPHCVPNFIGGLTASLSAGSLLSGESVYKDKLGEKIAIPGFNLRAQPLHKEFSAPRFVTADGYISENMNIVENGVLKTFLLDQFAAGKLGKERAKCDNEFHVVDPGKTPLADMIASVKRGLLLGGFSGGYPASNGDITGVAKNSFYIEDGKITKPVNECMIAGNIPQMLLAIQDISRETINFGDSLLPWIRFTGVTVSGK